MGEVGKFSGREHFLGNTPTQWGNFQGNLHEGGGEEIFIGNISHVGDIFRKEKIMSHLVTMETLIVTQIIILQSLYKVQIKGKILKGKTFYLSPHLILVIFIKIQLFLKSLQPMNYVNFKNDFESIIMESANRELTDILEGSGYGSYMFECLTTVCSMEKNTTSLIPLQISLLSEKTARTRGERQKWKKYACHVVCQWGVITRQLVTTWKVL